MVIGIDIDDTITETALVANKYVSLYDKLCHDYHNLPQDRYFEFLNLYLQDIVKNNILKDGVKEAFDYLKNNGYKIVIITARNDMHIPNVKNLTKEFLDKNNLRYDKLVFEETGIGDKSNLAKENNIDIFIDDKEIVLDKIAAVSNIECLRFTSDKNSKYKTFNNWQNIIEYLKTK